jgi:glycosyltransferase involved in cell wall biosynthesis
VQFAGSVDPDAVPAMLGIMDVAAAPYLNRSSFYFSPLKVLEYMAAGRAIVASALGQITELIEDGVNGLLVGAGNSKALAAALVRLTADAGMRRRLGAAARASVTQRHTWDGVAARIFELVDSFAANSPTSSLLRA